jgi:hypothetical protein
MSLRGKTLKPVESSLLNPLGLGLVAHHKKYKPQTRRVSSSKFVESHRIIIAKPVGSWVGARLRMVHAQDANDVTPRIARAMLALDACRTQYRFPQDGHSRRAATVLSIGTCGAFARAKPASGVIVIIS